MNTTLINNITDFQTLASATNSAVDGILFTGGMLVFYIIMIVIFIRYDQPIENAVTSSSWIMFMIAGLFWYAELVPTLIPLAFLFIAGLGVLYLNTSK
jgi:hypothetical protein